MAYAVGVFVCCLFYIMYLVVFIFVYHRRYATIETLINSQISYMEFVYIKNNKKEKEKNIMANILTREETERFNKLRKPFKKWEDKGWVCESPDNDTLVFFILGNDDDYYVETDFNGNIVRYKGINLSSAKEMVNSYLPSFKLANKI